ncbi:MAG: ATPase P [Acutalibacteraceae bacterium]
MNERSFLCIKTTLKIDGMMCGMCEIAHQRHHPQGGPVKKVSSSHTKGEAVVITETSRWTSKPSEAAGPRDRL